MLLAPDRHTRINSAVVRAHANATASHQGGAPFGVLFDRRPADLLDVATYAPECAFDTANAPGLAEGGVLVIDGASYRVSSDVQPDASGWVTVSLYPIA